MPGILKSLHIRVRQTGDRLSHAPLKCLSALFALFALLIFTIRGPLRVPQRGGDLMWNYLATRAWLHGLNPYSVDDALTVRGHGFPPNIDLYGIGTPYLPAVFPVSLPFSLVEWPLATIIFLIFILTLFVLLLKTMVQMYFHAESLITILFFLGLILIMHGPHSGVSMLNASVPASLLALLSMTREVHHRREILEAALYAALATAFKPQVGVVAFLYALVLWRWRVIIAGSVIYGVLTVVGSLQIVMSVKGFGWVGDIRENIAMVAAQQSDIYCCVNITPLLMHVVPQWLAEVWGLLIWLVVPALVWRFRPRGPVPNPDDNTQLAVMSICGLVMLLSIYARFYNLALLFPAVVLLVRTLPGGWEAMRKQDWRGAAPPALLAGALALFLQPVPLSALAWKSIGLSYLEWELPLQTAWTLLIVPVVTYALLLLLALMLWQAMGYGSFPMRLSTAERKCIAGAE